MTRTTLRRRGLGLVAAAALAAGTLVGTSPAAQAAEPAPTHGATIDYFDGVYGVGPGSVFETVTVERFEYLLKNKSGKQAFFIGDPRNPTSRATIAHINTVAKRLGIEKVYNFTPKLDGDTLNIWDLSRSGLRELGRTYYSAVGNRLLADYLTRDTTPQFTGDESTDPYLFVYDKDHKAGGAEDRIVASLTGTPSAADLDAPAARAAYEDQVEDVLGSVPADQYVTSSSFAFWKDESNRRHGATYPNAETHGGDVVTDADATEGWRIQTLTYPELEYLLQQPGDFPLLFGGTWCHNTRAIVGAVNAGAQKHAIRTVYNFDFSLFSTSNGGSNLDHIRDNPVAAEEGGVLKVARPSHLYGDLVNTYLTNAVTQYKKDGDPGAGSVNAVSYYPGGDVSREPKQARKIQVGHLLTYNKDHRDALGNRAPVVDQAIRQNDDGGNTEHMTEWWYVKGRGLTAGDPLYRGTSNPASETGANQLQNQRAFAKEALAEIDTVLTGFVGPALPSTTTVTGVGGADDAVPSPGSTPTIDVTVGAAGYDPFISLISANAGTAPSSATGKPRGVVALLHEGEKLSEARLKRDGTASLTLPPQAAGARTYTVTYTGRGGAIAPSSRTIEVVVPAKASTTTLRAPDSVAFGAGGTATATVTTEGPATGTVTLAGLPGGQVEARVSDGVATFAIPSTTAAGTHSLVASYKGDDTYGSSSSAATEVQVTKAKGRVTASPRGAAYGTGSTVVVTAHGVGGYVPTGTVQVTVAGTARPVTLDRSGKGKLTLPRTLAPKKYAVTVVYLGDRNLIASSTSSSVTVGKRAAGKVTFKKTASPTSKKAGKATVRVDRPGGLVAPTGTVTLTLKKGASTKTVRATLSGGTKKIKLPKLRKGTWKVTARYAGSTAYTARTSSTYTLVVKK